MLGTWDSCPRPTPGAHLTPPSIPAHLDLKVCAGYMRGPHFEGHLLGFGVNGDAGVGRRLSGGQQVWGRLEHLLRQNCSGGGAASWTYGQCGVCRVFRGRREEGEHGHALTRG